jgi:hypothetical protein
MASLGHHQQLSSAHPALHPVAPGVGDDDDKGTAAPPGIPCQQALQIKPSEFSFTLRAPSADPGQTAKIRTPSNTGSSTSDVFRSLRNLLEAIREESPASYADSYPSSNVALQAAGGQSEGETLLEAARDHHNQGVVGSVRAKDHHNQGVAGSVRARVFDWNKAELLQDQFDVLLACDLLYEDVAVEPIAQLVPWQVYVFTTLT